MLARMLGYYGITKMLQEGIFGHMPTLREVVSLQELIERNKSPKEATELIQFVHIKNTKQHFVNPQDFYDLSDLASSPAMDHFLYLILHEEGKSYP